MGNTQGTEVNLSDIQEGLSVCHISGIALMNGYTMAELSGRNDRHGIDMYIEGVHEDMYVKLHVQLKSTYSLGNPNNGLYSYRLDRGLFDKLRKRAQKDPMGCLLVVLCLPEQHSQWLNTTPDALTMRKCLYWSRASDWSAPARANQRKVSVTIPETNILDLKSLRSLMLEKVRYVQQRG